MAAGTFPHRYREEGISTYEAMQASLRQNIVFSFFAYRP
jgi:hypothetical protein